VTPGAVTRYDLEVFPTVGVLAPGHRLRLTLTTSDTPHLLPIASQAAKLQGGVYEVQRNAAAASYVELPLGDATLPATGLAGRFGSTSGRRVTCSSRRRELVHLSPRGRIIRVSVRVNGRRQRAVPRGTHAVLVSLAGRASGTYRVTVDAVVAGGRRVHTTRVYRTCTSGRRFRAASHRVAPTAGASRSPLPRTLGPW
jgi:hypothetical protein